jgi:amino acid adenylation domain-containing protein
MQRQRINATYADLPDMTLDACFVRQAKSIPEHYAIISSEGVLTYRELDEMSNQLAHCLLSKKTQLANQHVVVMMEKGWEQVVACLGIVKAGAAYVPLDADLPKERRLMLLDNSGAKWVITQPWLKETLEWPDSIEIMTVDEERLSSFSRERLPLYSRPDQLAYTIYTSGSTGFPKGVMIEHCGAVNTILDINERFGVTSRDRILAVSSLSFDLSVYDIFGALAAGATIVIPDAAFQRDSKHLGSVLSQWNVTLWNSAPVIMTNLVNYAEAINETFFDNLRLVLLSGDWIPTALPGKIWEQNPEVEVVSLGGATEASIWSICFPIKEVNASWRSIPYGKPLRNQQIWVLDANLSHCPDRVPGEIYIGGAGLSRGYWLDSKKTDQRFVYNPYTGERLYRTGDMGCYLEDGNVEFLGREDDQVKLRGHRVELGEIESILNQHPAIKRSLVNTVVDKRGNQQLVAYIISFLDIARIDLEVPCLITPQKAESGFKAKTFDISASGLAVEIQEEQLSRGDNCQVLIDLPGVSESQNLNAEVVWTRANQAGLMLDQNSRSLAALQQSIRYILRSQGFALMRLQHEGDSTGLHSIERAPFRHLCAVDNHEKQQQQELMAVSLSARGIEFIECPDHWLSGDAVSITLPALEGEHAISVDASILWHTGKYAMMVFDTTSESIARIAERVKNVIQNEGHWYSRYSITSVSDYLKDRLPHYMVPHYFILLDAFPLNFNGKINRKALPVPQLDDFEESGDVIVLQQRPETPTEIALAEIWESVLSIQQVSRNDNYFELGGNSIQLTQVAAEITRRFSIEVPLRLLFSLNKLKDHAKLVDEQVSLNDTAALKPISNQGEENSFPLSMSQQRLWFLDQMLDDGSFYNISAVRRLNGVVNTDILESVINEIIHRHDSLTTRFVETREGVRQMVEKPERFTLPVINLMSDPNKEQVLKEYIHKYYHWQFDLSSAPLFKIVLVQTALNECYLIVVFHHIVADGWSVRIFVNELQQLYRSKALGQPFTLPRPIIRYVDYAVWHREWFEQTVFEDQLNYWRKNLEGYTSLNFPTDKKRPLIQSYSGKTLGFVIDPDLEAKIRSHCTRYRVTPFIYFLSMFYLLLSRYSGQKDISIGTVNANRTRPETQDLIGFFVNTLVMRIKGEALVSVSELLRRVKEVSLEAYLNMDFPFEKLVEVLNIPRDTSRTPIFQVMFTLQNLQVDKISLPDIEIEPVQFDTASSKFDLTLELVEQEKGLIGSIEYATSLFDEQTIQTLIVRYQSLLEQVSSHEDMALSDIDILTHQEKIWIRENTTGAVLPIQIESVVSAFEQVARDFPGRLCVEDATQTLTYAQVDSWSTKLAHLIRKLNVGTCPRIGLSVERSVQMVVGMLAILKAGYAYVPIDPHYPLTRIRHCLEDAGLELVVLHTATEALYRESAVKRLNLDLPVEFSPSSLDTPLPHIKKSDPIYVIYTSGSTGVPKGVEVEHVGMANLCQWHQRVFDLSPQSRATQVAGMGFDACGWEIWPYITAGASVTVVDRETLLDPGAILHFLVSRKITHCFMPTPIAELLIDACWPAESELRFMLTGGDRLKHHPADSLPFTLVNNYGPTEVSVVSTSGNVPSGQAGFPTIGRPVDNLSVYILDAALQRVPPGVPGEVCIAGPGVARGYLNQPEATCKVFVENPYSERTEDARLYQTGDIARLTANGEIEYIGREDFQVKIRGNRIELGEIEAVLKEVESIADVVVLVREDFHDSATLVAYYTVKSGGAVDPDTLQSTLRARLPDYMIPAYCVRMTEFSLTANGKIDRHHLPKPTQEEGMITEIPVAPRNETERVMAEIWQEVIGVSTVGINQNFFELGGHSLKAARLVSRIQSELGYQVPVKTVFEAPTIERLMARIQIADALQEGHFLPIFRRDKSQHYPLSFAQQRLWFLSRLDTENSAYNITGAARLVGNLNLEIFRQALEEVIQRHEVLRSNFIEHDGEPVVTLSDFSSLELVIERLPAQSGEAQEAFFRQVLSEEQHYTFDLEHEHLIRLRLVEIEPNDHRLIVNVHHIVADGWSIGLLIKEVGELYSNKVEFGQFHLPPLVIQYGDYAIWNRESICSDGYEIALNYWLKKLDASLPLEVMTDYPRQTDSENRSCSADTLIHSDIAGRLNALAIKNSCSLFMVLLAGFDVLMSRLSGQYDFCVGAPVANRPDKNCEQLIGMFMNTVVFRMNFSEKDSFHSILKHVKQTTLEAYEHQNVPFEHIVEKLDLPKDLTRTPLFQIFFNMLNFPVHALSMAGVEVEIYDMPDSPGKFDMTFYLEESQDGITVRVIYDANLYKQTTIEMLLALYASTLEAVTLFPDKRVGELELTHPDAVPALPDPTDPILIRDVPSVLERFMTSVDHFGEKVAIESPYEKITYRDIYLRIVTLMSALQAKGAGTEARIAILAGRHPALVTSMCATLGIHATFVIIDPDYPIERITQMLEIADPLLLILAVENRDEAIQALLDSVSIPIVDALALHSDPEVSQRSDLASTTGERLTDNALDAPAYIAFTSGTTGRPKAMMGAQRPLAHFIDWHLSTHNLTHEDRFSMVSGLSHDPLLRDIFTPLSVGATLCIPDHEIYSDGVKLARWVCETNVTVSHLTPAMAQYLVESAGEMQTTALRYAFMAGDVLRAEHIHALKHFAPNIGVVNFYGSTETPQAMSAYRVPDGYDGARIPLGHGIEGVQLLVVNSAGKVASPGEVGEIWIRTPYLTQGYLDSDSTARNFIENPWRKESQDRLYCTGDMGRYRQDGEVEFLGRRDTQVKIRGYRVELSEVDAVLASHPEIKKSVTVAISREEDSPFLVSYCVPLQTTELPDSSLLRQFVSTRLPSYMVPDRCIALQSFPLTPNGKVDLRKLPAPESVDRTSAPYEPPETETESVLAKIWCEVLNCDRVSRWDDFFELGGHSLLATRVVARIKKEKSVSVPVKMLFEHSTLRELSCRVDELQALLAQPDEFNDPNDPECVEFRL